MSKTTEYRTKKKQAREANMDEAKSEVIEWMKAQFTASAKSREILEEYLDGKENNGERKSRISN